MAAFGASAVKATEKRVKGSTTANKAYTVETRVFSFVIPASSTVAGPIDLTGAFLPPGSYVLGGVVTPSQSLGSTTLAFNTKTANVIFSAATAYTAEKLLTNSIPVAVPSSATANDQIQCATAAATSPGTDTTVTVTLYLAPIANETSEYTTFSI